jgi:hypothetical protein
MPNRSRKPRTPPEDENEAAFRVLGTVIDKTEHEPTREKNPAAVALGRLGGLKGGKARAKKLSARRRKEIAAAAAQARWKKQK